MSQDGNVVDIKAEREKIQQKIKKDMEAAQSIVDKVANDVKDGDVVVAKYPNREESEKHSNDLREMNFRYAFVHNLGGKAMVKTTTYNEFLEKNIVDFISVETLLQIYSNRMAQETIGDKKGALTLGRWWLSHQHRKDYQTCTFEPEKEPGEYHVLDEYKALSDDKTLDKYITYFNLWEGFGVEPIKGTWKKTRTHIWRVLCNKDKVKFKYVMRWFAWAVQNPGTRAEVALIFKGKKGAGKGLILGAMKQIFGRHGLVISNREHLTGKHNEHLATCSFLFADEAYHPGDKEVEGILKNIITEPSLTTEPKFRNLKVGRNCLHIAMATNADWVIPATEDERRYFINEVDNSFAKGSMSDNERQQYFDGVWKELENGGISAMLYDLQHMQLGTWHPRQNVPETEELRRQISMSLPKIKYAFMTMLEDGIFPGSKDGAGRYVISNSNLTEYLKSLDDGSKFSGKQVSKLCKDLGIPTHKTSVLGRHYLFPELGELRAVWVREMSKNVEWRENEEWVVSSKF